MQTSRAILNERIKKPPSAYHRICTIDHPVPYYESEKINPYEFSHIKFPEQQLVFHKQELYPTPISLPTPPASPEFFGTSLQKWYQKKPLFTLTAKGQIKRLEKYLEIQKMVEICKNEHEFQIHTQRMKNIYSDFEFREHQPLLYEEKDICCVCPCNSSKNYDIDFIPVYYRGKTCKPPLPKICTCTNECKDINFEDDCCKNKNNNEKKEPNIKLNFYQNKGITTSIPIYKNNNNEENTEEKIIPTKIINEGDDVDDRGIYKIIVRNKDKPRSPDNNKDLIQLYDNKNYNERGSKNFLKTTSFIDTNTKSLNVSRITLDNVTTFPYDNIEENPKLREKSVKKSIKSIKNSNNKKLDVNKNEIY